MRRLLAAAIVGLMVAGAFPVGVLAAAPIALAGNSFVAEDLAATVTISATDGGGGDVTSFDIVADSAVHGVAGTPSNITCPGSGTCTADVLFSPEADYYGTASFQFTATGPDGTSTPATAAILVAGVNDAPSFTSGANVTVNEDSGAYSAAWATAISPGPGEIGQTVDFNVSATNPALFQAAPAISPTGTLTFEPKAQWSGMSTVTVSLHDNGGLENYGIPGVIAHDTSAEVQLTLSVTAVNDAPAPVAGNATVPEDTQWLIPLSASDVEGNPTIAFALASGPSHGSVDLSAAPGCDGLIPNTCTGAAIYTPALNYSGPDSFTYTATDGTTASAPATVAITVTAVNDQPVCAPLSLATDKNVPVSDTVACSDIDGIDTLTLRIGTAPAKGTVAPFSTATGAFTYTPDHDVTGADSFTVIANDGTADSAPATVTLAIANNAPTCTGASPAAANEDTQQTGSLACSDPDHDTLTYGVVDQPAHGSATIDPLTGAWTYTPAQDWNSTDSFTARATDGTAVSNTVTVSLTITPVNDAPICPAVAPAAKAQDLVQSGIVTCADAENDGLTYHLGAPAGHGVTVVNADGSWMYTPVTNYNGTDNFTFMANDGQVDAIPATATLAITDVNQAPVAHNDAIALNATTTTTLNVLTNDVSGPKIGSVTSEPLDPITITSVTAAGKGAVSIIPAGTGIVYDPKACASGTDLFSYTITDGGGNAATANVIVTIARPGENGLSSIPITDTPTVGLRAGSTMTTSVPTRVAWCGVTRFGVSLSGYRVDQSSNAGASYGTSIFNTSTTTSITRGLGIGTSYRWRARTVDAARRTSLFTYSAVTRLGRLQERSTALHYSGTWSTTTSTRASGGAMKSATSSSAKVSFTVTNVRQFAIITPKGSGFGSIRVFVDHVLVATVSERASTNVYRKLLTVRSVTPVGSHLVELQPAGNGRVYLDAIVTLQ